MSEKVLSFLYFLLAAFAEISGCYTFWIWLRMGKSMLWIIPGTLALISFAIILSRVDSDYAGRAYAAYGGIYILSSLIWFWLVEGVKPDWWDLGGAMLSLFGTAVIVFGSHHSKE